MTMPTTTTAADVMPILTLLRQAHRECTARGDLATHPLDDQGVWHSDAMLVWIAIETLSDAADPPVSWMAVRVPDTDLEPLQLLTAAMELVLQLPDDIWNVDLFQSRLDISDALHALRMRDAWMRDA